MSDPSLLAVALLAKGQTTAITLPKSPQSAVYAPTTIQRSLRPVRPIPNIYPEELSHPAEFSAPAPRSGSQLYVQRLSALRSGKLHTRLPRHSFYTDWRRASGQPTYGQWKRLLAQEANVVARWQNGRRLSIIVGDSISLWYPSYRLPQDQLWLNQAISGETTRGALKRLTAFVNTKPNAIYVMAGINDLKRGATDEEILRNLLHITRTLKRHHPHAQIVLQSILPTRLSASINARIQQINQQLAAIADQENAVYLDLYANFANADGSLRPNLTTDGLHLSQQGYEAWESAFQHNLRLAQQRGVTSTTSR